MEPVRLKQVLMDLLMEHKGQGEKEQALIAACFHSMKEIRTEIIDGEWEDGTHYNKCPHCGREMDKILDANRCHICGQKLDWSNVNDR